MKLVSLSFLAILCISCQPSRYKLITQNYVPIEVNETRTKKYIFLMDRYFKDTEEISALINSKRWLALEKAVEKMDDPKAKKFLEGVKMMMKRNYLEALNQFRSLNRDDFDCQAKILLTDCLYELKADTVNFRKGYQEALDCTTSSQVREIALKRYRFLKYEK